MIPLTTPRRVEKPWGYELILAHTDRYVGKILHIDRGQLLSRQYHRIKDETVYVLRGTLILEIGPAESVERVEVPAGQGFRTLPETIHRYVAPDDTDIDLIETSTPELEDVVRLEDVYGREGTDRP
jgi:mannose-6-phosphate isomerase-like protein (cupin superfamily)